MSGAGDTVTVPPLVREWSKRLGDALNWHTITKAHYIPVDTGYGEPAWFIELVLDDGRSVLVQSDPEGNGPGAIAVGQEMFGGL